MARFNKPSGTRNHKSSVRDIRLTVAGIFTSVFGILSLIHQSEEGLGMMSMSMSSLQELAASGAASLSTSSSTTASSSSTAAAVIISKPLSSSSTPPLVPPPPEPEERVARALTVSPLSSSAAAVSSSSSWADNDPWKPVDCEKLLYEFAHNISEHPDPNKNQLYGRLTKTKTTPVWISLHNSEFDRMRFAVFDFGYYYEKALTAIFQEILGQSSPDARVLDVGGNIGWFTLLSASLGHHVDVFEANILNVLRLCQSATLLNHWPTATESSIGVRTVKQSSINIHNMGVSDGTTSTMDLFFAGNPGAGSFLKDGAHPSSKQGSRKMSSIPMMSLDQMATDLGWLDTNSSNIKPKFAIMKLDVEGFEPNVVAGATKFLASGLVENILMEMSGSRDTRSTVQMIQNIVDAGYVLHKTGHYEGPKVPPPKELPSSTSPEYAQAFVRRLVPRPKDKANLWWKFKGMTL